MLTSCQSCHHSGTSRYWMQTYGLLLTCILVENSGTFKTTMHWFTQLVHWNWKQRNNIPPFFSLPATEPWSKSNQNVLYMLKNTEKEHLQHRCSSWSPVQSHHFLQFIMKRFCPVSVPVSPHQHGVRKFWKWRDLYLILKWCTSAKVRRFKKKCSEVGNPFSPMNLYVACAFPTL